MNTYIGVGICLFTSARMSISVSSSGSGDGSGRNIQRGSLCPEMEHNLLLPKLDAPSASPQVIPDPEGSAVAEIISCRQIA